MDQAGPSTALVFDLEGSSPFSFKCQVCSVCCSNKAIRVGPYEALRLARRLGITTTELFRIYTEGGGTELLNKPDGTCVFLGSRGCSVHPDRPLVCRLFPLGLLKDEQGAVKFAVMPLHPDCLGLIDTDTRVEGYLESQGATPYFRYEKIYSAIQRTMVEKLSRARPEDKAKPQAAAPEGDEQGAFTPGGLFSYWIDIDACLTARGHPPRPREPADLDELVRLHVQALEDGIGRL